MTGVFLRLFLAAATAGTPVSTSPSTFCVEWVRQSGQGYERLTLFRDGTLVWKRSRDGGAEVERKPVEAEELRFYCEYFSRTELWSSAGDLRSSMTGDLVGQSLVVLARPDGSRKEIRFDDLSALTFDASALRSSLEGLRSILTSPLAPASRFTSDRLPSGTLLKRFDGILFRVRRLDSEKGVVELEGVREPYTQFRKIEELRFQFSPPE